MQRAIDAGQRALDEGNEPYGALVVRGDVAVEGRNVIVTTTDPTAHAELVAIRNAAREWGSLDLSGATLYASFEPCPMCLGAMLASGITKLVIAARRVLGEGSLGDYSVEQLLQLTRQSSSVTVESGLLADQCARMMAPFFAASHQARR